MTIWNTPKEDLSTYQDVNDKSLELLGLLEEDVGLSV